MMYLLNDIYSKMGDELSKQIYLRRLNYSISKDYEYINQILNISIRDNNLWTEFVDVMSSMDDSEVVLFGNGIWGVTLISELRNFHWKSIIDNTPKINMRGTIPVIKASDFFKNYKNEKIVISSYKHKESMVAQCVEAGVPYINVIDAASVIYKLTEGRIYFDNDIPINLKEGVFVDGGCYDGSDTKRFVELFDDSAICFEPDTKNIDKITKNLIGYEDRYRVISKALWSEDTLLSFSSDGNCGSHIDLDNHSDGIVRAGSIDKEVGNTKVSMIKMDIEGSELEALHGTKRIIDRDHPVLAISIYHKLEDVFSIPQYILEVYSGYKFYIRHYSFSWYDTVLYAIPEELR